MTELSYPMPTNAGENYIIKLWCLYRLKIAVFFEVIIVIFEISFCNCSSKWFFSGFPLVDPFAIISHLQLCNFSIQYLKKKKNKYSEIRFHDLTNENQNIISQAASNRHLLIHGFWRKSWKPSGIFWKGFITVEKKCQEETMS